MMVFAGILFIPMFCFWLGMSLVQPKQPQNIPEICGRVLVDEMLIVALLFFTIGFLWGLTGSRTLKSFLDLAAHRLAWILIVLLMVFVGLVINF